MLIGDLARADREALARWMRVWPSEEELEDERKLTEEMQERMSMRRTTLGLKVETDSEDGEETELVEEVKKEGPCDDGAVKHELHEGHLVQRS